MRISDWSSDVCSSDLDHIVTRIVDETGYMSSIRSDLAEAKNNGDKDAVEALSTRLSNIEDLINIAKGKNLSEFLDHLGLWDDTRRDQGKGVWIGTIPAAKGLAFFTVYLPAWQQVVLPFNQALADGDLEDERRERKKAEKE